MAIDLPRDAELWGLLAKTLEPTLPEPETRARLFAEIDGAARYLPFAGDLAQYFELPRDRIRELLSCIDDPAHWKRGLSPFQGSLHFSPGASLQVLHGGFARMNPGAQIARHRHVEREVTYILEGALRDGDGVRFGPGQAIEMPAGSEHSLIVDGDSDTVIALLNGALEMLG